MVLVDGKSCPVKFHDTIEEASLEAKRLALKEGVDTYILKKVGFVQVSAEVKIYRLQPEIKQCQCINSQY